MATDFNDAQTVNKSLEIGRGSRVGIISHTATPEGVVTASIGAICLRTDNGATYRKTSGSGTNGWVEFGSGGGAPTVTSNPNTLTIDSTASVVVGETYNTAAAAITWINATEENGASAKQTITINSVPSNGETLTIGTITALAPGPAVVTFVTGAPANNLQVTITATTTSQLATDIANVWKIASPGNGYGIASDCAVFAIGSTLRVNADLFGTAGNSITTSTTSASITGTGTLLGGKVIINWTLNQITEVDSSSFTLPRHVSWIGIGSPKGYSGLVKVDDGGTIYTELTDDFRRHNPTIRNIHFQDGGKLLIESSTTEATDGSALVSFCDFHLSSGDGSAVSIESTVNSTRFGGLFEHCGIYGNFGATSTGGKIKLVGSDSVYAPKFLFNDCQFNPFSFELDQVKMELKNCKVNDLGIGAVLSIKGNGLTEFIISGTHMDSPASDITITVGDINTPKILLSNSKLKSLNIATGSLGGISLYNYNSRIDTFSIPNEAAQSTYLSGIYSEGGNIGNININGNAGTPYNFNGGDAAISSTATQYRLVNEKWVLDNSGGNVNDGTTDFQMSSWDDATSKFVTRNLLLDPTGNILSLGKIGESSALSIRELNFVAKLVTTADGKFKIVNAAGARITPSANSDLIDKQYFDANLPAGVPTGTALGSLIYWNHPTTEWLENTGVQSLGASMILGGTGNPGLLLLNSTGGVSTKLQAGSLTGTMEIVSSSNTRVAPSADGHISDKKYTDDTAAANFIYGNYSIGGSPVPQTASTTAYRVPFTTTIQSNFGSLSDDRYLSFVSGAGNYFYRIARTGAYEFQLVITIKNSTSETRNFKLALRKQVGGSPVIERYFSVTPIALGFASMELNSGPIQLSSVGPDEIYAELTSTTLPTNNWDLMADGTYTSFSCKMLELD